MCTALTLLTSPKLAYFDEPTVGLDPVARRNLLNLIKLSGASVLFTTHRLDEAEYLCTRVAIIQQGKILYDGTIEDIKKAHSISASQGLILVKNPKIFELHTLITYLALDQSDSDQALYRIKTDGVKLSKIFADFNQLKLDAKIEDFTYFEPSLHHAFVALSSS